MAAAPNNYTGAAAPQQQLSGSNGQLSAGSGSNNNNQGSSQPPPRVPALGFGPGELPPPREAETRAPRRSARCEALELSKKEHDFLVRVVFSQFILRKLLLL